MYDDDLDVEATSCHFQESAPQTRRPTGRTAETKKLVFLSKTVLELVRQSQNTTGSDIAQKILDIYRQQKKTMDFKNVQRRVYDALNVLSALKFIRKDRGRIIWQGIFVSQGGRANLEQQKKMTETAGT